MAFSGFSGCCLLCILFGASNADRRGWLADALIQKNKRYLAGHDMTEACRYVIDRLDHELMPDSNRPPPCVRRSHFDCLNPPNH